MLKSAKEQITFISASIILTGFALAAIVNFTDPKTASRLTHVFFYLSLFLFILGVFTLIGLGLRLWLSDKIYVVNLAASFRQGLLLALLTTASFLLLAGRLLFWWVEAALILFFLCVEVFLNLKI